MRSRELLGTVWLGALGLLLAGCMVLEGRSGVVIEPLTRKPVAGATVELECRKALIHGTKVLRTVSVVTDEKGAFTFSKADVAGCSLGIVRPSKAGYLDGEAYGFDPYVHNHYERMPAQLVLIPEAQLHAVLFRRLVDPASLDDGGERMVERYEHAYRSFAVAKNVAESPGEMQAIAVIYCPRLASFYDALTAEQRARVNAGGWSAPDETHRRWFGPDKASFEFSHSRHVLAWCATQATR